MKLIQKMIDCCKDCPFAQQITSRWGTQPDWYRCEHPKLHDRWDPLEQ